MLKYTFYEPEDIIRTIDGYFDHNYEDAWLEDPFVKQMVKDIDNTTVLSPTAAESPIFGVMPITQLSGGVKALILMLKTDLVIWTPACGDNCTDYMIKIGTMRDCVLYVGHYLGFSHDFTALCLDTNEVTHTVKDFEKMCLRHFAYKEI